jgi:serine/threonine protein kinase/tetratricopeptide (TPR) repeat protein
MNIDEKAVFLAALALPDAKEREAYLQEACVGHPKALGHLRELLSAHEEPQGPLDRRPAALGATVDVAHTERPGAVIGPYKLLQQIGEGGMGTVYMAEQTQPVHRKVALKVIKPGMDSRQVVARFEAERQALAIMDHVNIARVFDGGATESGRPYFVMELVHGVPITKYCDDNHLTPRERLELFVPVCQAIQHAHQKGIIHRDIKPSNVMVTLYDGKPVPKVIDFGVAKATDQKLTERTLFTQYGTMVGTFEYMSPEQAEMSALGVDTRSDIYSLGVLLYELLTGSTPLTHKRMQEAAFAEILRMIKEEEPPRPSTRLSDSGEALASISANRHTEPAKLTKLVRGELDWIVMKTLEKDRNRRYETAKDFAVDVQRYLNDEPVQACPPSAGYRMRKFVRRNKRPLATAGFIGLALLGALVTLAVSNVIIAQERDAKTIALGEKAAALIQAQANKEAADHQRQRAEENLELSVSVLDQILLVPAEKRRIISQQEQNRLLAANPERLKLELDLIEKGAEFYAQFAKRNSADPAAQLKAASACRWLAYIQQHFGQQEKSVQTFRQGLRYLESPALAQSKDSVFLWTQADLYHQMYFPLFALRRFVEAEEVTHRGLEIYETLAARTDGAQAPWEQRTWSHLNLGDLAVQAGRDLAAEQAFRKARAVCDDWLQALPGNFGARYQKATAGNRLGDFYSKARRWDEALATWERVGNEWEILAKENHDNLGARWSVAGCHAHVGVVHFETGRYPEADKAFAESQVVWEKLAGETNLPDHRFHLGCIREWAGRAHAKLGRLPEAAADYQAAIVIWEKLVTEFNVPDHRGHLASSQAALKEVLQLQEKQAEHAKLAEAVARHRKAIEVDPKDAAAYYGLGVALKAQGKLDQAIDAYRKAVELDPKNARAHASLGASLHVQGMLDQAIDTYDKAVALDPKNAVVHTNLAWILATCPDPKFRDGARAAKHAKIAVEVSPKVINVWSNLGVAQYRAGQWKEARAALEKADHLANRGDYFHRFFLAMAQWQLGNKEEARKSYDQAVQWMDKNLAQNEELRRFRAEAEELLGVKEKKE